MDELNPAAADMFFKILHPFVEHHDARGKALEVFIR
jgi:hypothetical protein